MKTLAKFFLKNRALSWLLLVLILLGGVVAYVGMGKLEDAPFTIKQAVVTTTYPGASPLEVQQQVTDVLEEAIQSLGEASGLVQRHGLSPSIFIKLMTQTLFACPSYQRYGQNIVSSNFEPGFKLSLGLKDMNLAIDAGRIKGLELPAADAVRLKMTSAVARGDGDKDWSVFAQQTNH